MHKVDDGIAIASATTRDSSKRCTRQNVSVANLAGQFIGEELAVGFIKRGPWAVPVNRGKLFECERQFR